MVKDMITSLRHIGIIVDDAERSTGIFKALFDLGDDEVVTVPTGATGGSSVYAFIPVGGVELELIEPVTAEFRKMLGEPKPGINHLAFTVTDLDAAIARMRAKGVRLGHVTADGVIDTGRSKVAYFNPEDTGGILIEFVEPRA